ncbi:MAG TPA: pentapeptide repeat-containing protein [Pseudonocardiaceae bacterium]|nr:pentapeptide repeat-containing protein [Pseudonocardiaceae bacterium]
MAEADLHGCRTEGCRFVECVFRHTDLVDAKHTATAFHNCRFDHTMLTRWTLDGCSLLGSTFLDCRMRPITMRDTDLTLVSLTGANLREATFAGLRLRDANLMESDLRDVDLRDADLTGARLLGTRLEGADLRGARIDADGLVQAGLRGARIDLDTAVRFAAAHGLVVS